MKHPTRVSFTHHIVPNFVNSRQVIVMDKGHIVVRHLMRARSAYELWELVERHRKDES